MEKAIEDSILKEKLLCLFNDANENSTKDLEMAIKEIPGIDTLTHMPIVQNDEVGSEMVKIFESMNLIPCFFFVDPWGYKGLSLGLVNSVIKDWACECVFFFNYNRINMGLPNEIVREHMNALFTEEEADKLRARIATYEKPLDKELDIVETLSKALNPDGSRYVLPFTFKNEHGNRTSHHLFFVSKHIRGYEIMKEVMARESTSAEQGVASFCYNPADSRFPILFEYGKPLDSLKINLINRLAGRSTSVIDIFNEHHIGTPFIKKNFKQAIIELELEGKIRTTRSKRNHQRGECPDQVIVTFPS